MTIVNARYCRLNNKVINCERKHTSISYKKNDLFLTFYTPIFSFNVHAFDFENDIIMDDDLYEVTLYPGDLNITFSFKMTESGYKKIRNAYNVKAKIST